jgi:hypothetical protein
MNRHESRLAEFRLTDREDSLVELDVPAIEIHCFGDPHAGYRE